MQFSEPHPTLWGRWACALPFRLILCACKRENTSLRCKYMTVAEGSVWPFPAFFTSSPDTMPDFRRLPSGGTWGLKTHPQRHSEAAEAPQPQCWRSGALPTHLGLEWDFCWDVRWPQVAGHRESRPHLSPTTAHIRDCDGGSTDHQAQCPYSHPSPSSP